MLRVVLADGALMIDSTTPTESITLRSQSNNYNDNVFHSLKVALDRKRGMGTTGPAQTGSSSMAFNFSAVKAQLLMPVYD